MVDGDPISIGRSGAAIRTRRLFPLRISVMARPPARRQDGGVRRRKNMRWIPGVTAAAAGEFAARSNSD
jgi:hypothetical protein